MRPILERIVSAGFTTGVFVLLFGLAARVQSSEASVTIAPLGAETREAVFLPVLAEGDPAPQVVEPSGESSEPGQAAPASSETRSFLRAPVREASGEVGYVGDRQRVASGQGGSSKKTNKKRECVEPTGQIEDQGGGEYVVEKALVDTYANDLGAASTLAWATWHEDASGETDGFRVRRIQCGSPLHEAGFRNGDVVHSVNGREITTIPDALVAYRKVKRRDTLKVELTRKDGTSERLKYRLR